MEAMINIMKPKECKHQQLYQKQINNFNLKIGKKNNFNTIANLGTK